MEQNVSNIDFSKSGGIVPVIVQDANTKEILTLAYTNKESLERTLSTGNSWFWSRSRKKLWMKGEESGNTQKIKEMNILGNEGTDEDTKEAIRGALTLYLDFINCPPDKIPSVHLY